MSRWADDMDRAMQQHPEQFGMVLDEELNPVDRPLPGESVSRDLAERVRALGNEYDAALRSSAYDAMPPFTAGWVSAVDAVLALLAESTPAAPDEEGLRTERVDAEYEFSFGQPLCAVCRHPHSDGAWTLTDHEDGTCWSTAGPLVCGCPKFITPAVKRIRQARALASQDKETS